MNVKSTTFENTLAGLAGGLQVRHIATFGLQTCTPDERIADVLTRFSEFDQIPVKEGDCLIGIVERNGK